MKIAVAQISCVLGDVPANLAKVREFTERAKSVGGELILFPEMTDTATRCRSSASTRPAGENGAVFEMQKIAAAHAMALVAGVSEREGAHIYNAQVVIDSLGQIVAKYRKTHLFTPPPIEEHTCFTAGAALRGFACAEMQFGLSICYDLRFPEIYRALALEEAANAFLISSAWPFPRAEHLRTLALARAIDNQSYVVLSNRVGSDASTNFCGGSAIIDPYGVILAAGSADREELLLGEISAEVVAAVRQKMPVLGHRRADLYDR